MIRRAFVMKVNPDCHAEYIRRHNPIWPELHETLTSHGVRNYSIFLDEESSTLLGYVEIADPEKYALIAQTEVCRRWWKHMAPIMPSNPDNSPVSRDLREVFHLA